MKPSTAPGPAPRPGSVMADLRQRLTERLSVLVQQILEAVEDSVGRYREETVRTQRENESLRRKLQLLISNGGGSIRSSSGSLNPPQMPPVQQQILKPQIQFPVQSSTALEDSGEAPPPLVLTSSSIHLSVPAIKAEDEETALDRLNSHEDIVGLSPRMVMSSGPSEAQRCDHGDDHGFLLKLPLGDGVPRQTDQRRKPYACERCSKSFCQSADLRRHMRTHTGERPHPCTFCSKSFSQRGNLRRHLRIHTGERPYGCPQCGRTFSDGDTMKKHKRTHLHQRPHGCPQCGRTFSCSSGLRTHLRRTRCCGTDDPGPQRVKLRPVKGL